MKTKLLYFVLFCIISVFSYSQELSPKFSLIEVEISSSSQFETLLAKGFDVDFRSTSINQVSIIANEHDLLRLKELGYTYSVVHDDLTKHIQKNLYQPSTKSLEIGNGSMGGYFTYDEFIEFIDSIQPIYSNIMSQPIVIGQTFEARDIIAYRISNNPEVDQDKPRSFINGLHHAREPMSMVAPLYFTQWLLENYETDELATYIVDNRETWFVPVVNIDGYIYNEEIAPNGGGMWRKNMRDNSGDGQFDPGFDGVDLNRNYGYGWGYNNVGSSGYPGSQIYRGTAPFSEPEAEAVRQLCIERGFNTALNFHTFGNLFIYPEEPDGTPFPDQDTFREYGHDATKSNGYIFGNGSETVQYIVNGDTDSWMYGEQEKKNKIFSFTPEIGNQFDFFWAPTNRIIQLAQDNLYLQQYIVMVAGVYLKIEDYRYNDIEEGNGNLAAEAGETLDLIIDVRNKGWAMGAQSVTATLLCEDEFVTINNNTYVTDFDALTTEELVFSITLSDDTPTGHTATISLHFADEDGYNITETIDVIFGKPFLKLYDIVDNGTEQWTADDNWGVTTERSYEGQYSFNDSPYSTTEQSAYTALTLAEPIDLAGLNNAILSFQTRYNFLKDRDMAQLQISTDNGDTWEPLAGQYSTPGAGTGGVQPLGEPVYNGFRDLMWVNEEISLLPYLEQEILIRFLIVSTSSSIKKEGWFIDDVKIIAYGDEYYPPEIVSYTKYYNTDFQGPFPVEAIISSQQENLTIDLFYSTDGNNFNSISMQAANYFRYEAEIPMMDYGTTVHYYIEVTDEENNTVSTDVNVFIVTDEPPVIHNNIDEITTILPLNESEEHTLTITNSGLLPLNWSITAEYVESRELLLIISDPEGDQTGNSPDIIALYAQLLNDDSVYLELEFADDINPSTMMAFLVADTDQNIETGLTGEYLFGYSGWDIGIDYIVVWDTGNQYGLGSLAFVLDETLENITGTSDITVDGNTMSTIIPFSFLGDDDGNMDVAVFTYVSNGYDAAPNQGHGTIGKPGISRWLTFDITGGTIDADEYVDVATSIKTTAISSGIYHAEILIESNDPENPVVSIPVSLTVLSNENNLLDFSFDEQSEPADINNNDNTISITLNPGVPATNLTAYFSLSEGANAFIGSTEQQSGETVNDFSEPVVYTIVAEDGIVSTDWTVLVSTTVGIEDLTIEEIPQVYPNPAENQIFVTGISDGSITIYNLMGIEVMNIKNYKTNQPIDVSNMPQGMYVIIIRYGEKNISKLLKIMK